VEERASLAGTSQDGREMGRFWLMGGALLLTLLLGVLLAARPADASTRIKLQCNVYATNMVDPIFFTDHQHNHIGNRTTTNESTGESLKAAGTTSCNAPWFTSAGWFPVVRDTQQRVVPLVARNQVVVYYRNPGDNNLQPIPTGLGLFTNDFKFQGGTGTSSDRVTLTFPDCWDQKSLNPANMVFSRQGRCPTEFSYRIPRLSYVIRYSRTVTNQFQVSAGTNAWAPFTEMHADYLAANQDVFNEQLITRCLAPGRAGVDPACEPA
jgi:hypothetical protein